MSGVSRVTVGPPRHDWSITIWTETWAHWYWDGRWWTVIERGNIPICWHEAGT